MKKILACALALGLSVTSFVQPALAATLAVEPVEAFIEAPASANEPTTKELENIIKLVKPKLEVPEECSEFDWNYNSPNYNRAASWRLTWFSKDYDKEVNVVCDNKGNIISYSIYDYSEKRAVSLPKFSKNELEKTAYEFLCKLCPVPAQSFKLESSGASSLYSGNFVYRYVRYENGIIVPDNNATVEVSYKTGKAVSLNCNFNHSTDFKATPVIDQEKAKDTLSGNQKMTLSYRLKTEYNDEGKVESRKAYLVYTPEVSYLSVDAASGKVYTERDTWVINTTTAGGNINSALKGDYAASDSMAREESGEYELSEEELAQLEVLEKLVSRQAAIDSVLNNKKLYIDNEATAIEAQLTKISVYSDYYYGAKDDKDSDLYQWNIYFSAPSKNSSKENGYFSHNMSAVVDAQNGALISFRANVPGYSYYVNDYKKDTVPEIKYTAEEAKNIFADFAAEMLPDKAKHTRCVEASESTVINYLKFEDGKRENPVYRTTSVNCVRVNEGVDFTYNSINGSVDKVTGKITRFTYSWYDNIEFESPKDAISPEDAYRVLLDSDGFGLNYEINSNYTYNKYLEDSAKGTVDIDKLYETEIYSRLVYSGYNYKSTVVSALSGKIINWSGEIIEQDPDYNYTDISGHWAEEDIKTLADLGFGFESGVFRPDASITADEFLNLMNFFNKYAQTLSEKETEKNSTITRTEAIKYIIDAEGYYKIACMPDIFITDFADNSELKREDVGFIAIARGLGLVQGDANKFRPYDALTRAEAVTVMFNYVELDK